MHPYASQQAAEIRIIAETQSPTAASPQAADIADIAATILSDANRPSQTEPTAVATPRNVNADLALRVSRVTARAQRVLFKQLVSQAQPPEVVCAVAALSYAQPPEATLNCCLISSAAT